MLKKTLLLCTLLCNVLVAVKSETDDSKPNVHVRVDCGFVQTNSNIELTYGVGSFTIAEVNFAARYVTNPYTQSQWEEGIVIGHLTGCSTSAYVYGQRTQYDGRVMEAGITPSGDVVIKWICGPVMPTSTSPFSYYFMEMPHVILSTTGL